VTPVLRDIVAARQRIRDRVDATPLRPSEWLTRVAGAPVALKLECVQPTGSFKLRGAVNALLELAATAVAPRAVVTASAGNHGRAVAHAARILGMHATVFAPHDAPQAKLAPISRDGADLRREASYDAAEAAARAFATDNGLPFVSPYNDADVIAGAGTIALELFEADPAIQTIVVPVGGGGLASGIGIAAKAISPRARLIGVETEASHAMLASLRAGRITSIEPQPTLADGLAGNLEAGAVTFEIVRRYVDEIVVVSEEEIARAIAGLVAEEHVIAEGAGAVAAAAILARRVHPPGATVALVTGGNIDVRRLLTTLREQPHD
jgi:threonine dehydratase